MVLRAIVLVLSGWGVYLWFDIKNCWMSLSAKKGK